jgi:type I restriction enzyme M protein
MASVAITEQELEQKLLAACNRLRGPVDPTDYKAYIFPLLFLKRISDAWDWEYQRALEGFAGDEELAKHPDNFRFVLPASCHWNDVRKLHENVGAGLQKILQRIEQANPETLAGIFGDVQWANKEKLPEHVLVGVIDEFSTLQLDPDSTPSDILGAAYEYLLKYFADESGKKAGEFFTPRSVVRLLTLLLDPSEGQSVHDPACGSGGILVEMVNVVREHGGDARTLRLSGQEVSLTTAAIARMNLFLHDIEDFRIIRGDTLRDPRFRVATGGLEQFDVVMANPPFSLSPWGQEAWADDPFGRSRWGVPPAQFGDFAFVEHMLSVMRRPAGRVAVVMPQGVLSRNLHSEIEIRKNILQDNVLDCVIGLPRDMFYNTDLPACILVFDAARDRTTPLLFVDASARFKKAQGERNAFGPDDIEAIVQVVHTRSADGIEGIRAADVTLIDIEANDWNMNIPIYVETVIEEFESVAALVGQYVGARNALRTAEDALAAQLQVAGVLTDE